MAEAPSLLAPWYKPEPPTVTHDVGLMVMNSLTRKKEKFMTMDGGRSVKWYMCGPTVYAASHMGHARTYLGFDIIRRILRCHFGYDVTLIVNITDLDDKIIQRANERGVAVTDLAQQYEREFMEDMASLGVARADIVTRVTDYIDEIVAYIQHIVDRELAYESNGSVYFHVAAFESLEGMRYCKLAPEQIHNSKLLEEGEGKLTQDFLSDKRSPRDFALWKKSKDGEPKWTSPWGEGRPGWHIECSVMASHILSQLFSNPTMDIHSGGEDLKFPHHDNELAQAEAHCGCNQWVNYFLHSGHLHIMGFKMSKSLKNFITIRQAMEQHSARQIRLCFLMHKYNAPMDYGDNTMSHALVTERLFTEFFHNVKATLRENTNDGRWGDTEQLLQKAVTKAKADVNAAFQDDFDTPTALNALVDLVRATNLYMDGCDSPVTLVLRNAGLYVTHVFRVLGLIPDGEEIGFPIAGGEGGAEATLTPVLNAVMDFRASVREMARVKDISGVLSECDSFRDETLPPLGIRLEDKSGGKSVWKLVDPTEWKKEQEQRELETKRRDEEHKKALETKSQKDAWNKMSPMDFMKHLTLEDDDTKLKYSQFDETTGLPTHFQDGELLNKNQSKKASREFNTQQKKYEKYLKSLE